MNTRFAKSLVMSSIMIVSVFAQPATIATSFAAQHKAISNRQSRHRDTRDRAIRFEIVLNASAENVWKAWTTKDGIKSFFAPECDIDLRVLGKYDILFEPSAPAGLRGAENNLILAIQEGKLLSFTWDAPPLFPNIRKQRTSVTIRLAKMDQNRTMLFFTQSGWGEGDEWDKVFDYFVMAWGEVVLPFLKHSLETGPIDWTNPPQKLAKAKLIA